VVEKRKNRPNNAAGNREDMADKSEQQKERLAEEIAKDVMDVLHYGEESVSVAIEEIKSAH
jgi:phenylpyruvate tautomerase PptA (4-oxalocrotonate tautomerase family)